MTESFQVDLTVTSKSASDLLAHLRKRQMSLDSFIRGLVLKELRRVDGEQALTDA